MRYCFLFLILTATLSGQSNTTYTSQLNHTVSGEKLYLEHEVDSKPKLVYGENAMYRFLSRNFKFPKEGTAIAEIICSFIIEVDGTLSDPKVVNPVPENYAQEALRVLRKFKEPWYPAIKNNQQVRCQYVVPLIFNN